MPPFCPNLALGFCNTIGSYASRRFPIRHLITQDVMGILVLPLGRTYPRFMRKKCILWVLLLTMSILTTRSGAATKVHVIAFGKWISVQWQADSTAKPLPLKVHALVVDGRVREYAIGTPHEVTERLFVVQRVFRVNDSLPEDSIPRWQWQRGGWLLVDRLTGRVSSISMPGFDNFYSAASWYRDYVSYCAVSDDGKKVSATVVQLNRRRPVVKKLLSGVALDEARPDSACPAPVWQRSPVRVSFETSAGAKQTFAIRGFVADVVTNEDDEEADD